MPNNVASRSSKGRRGGWKRAVERVGTKRARNLRPYRRYPRGAKDSFSTNNKLFKTNILSMAPKIPFKDNYYCSLTYAQTFAIVTNNGADTIARVFLVPNDINNILSTSVHYPSGYLTQIAYLYNYIEVIGIKYQVTFQDPSNDGMCVGISMQGGDDPIGYTLQRMQERGRTVFDYVSNTGTQVKTFSGYLKPWKVLGLNKVEYLANISQMSVPTDGATSITGARKVFMNVWASNANLQGTGPRINVDVKYELICKCFGIKALN